MFVIIVLDLLCVNLQWGLGYLNGQSVSGFCTFPIAAQYRGKVKKGEKGARGKREGRFTNKEAFSKSKMEIGCCNNYFKVDLDPIIKIQ